MCRNGGRHCSTSHSAERDHTHRAAMEAHSANATRAAGTAEGSSLPFRVPAQSECPSPAVLQHVHLDQFEPLSLHQIRSDIVEPGYLDDVEDRRRRARQRYVDLCVAAARQQRFLVTVEDREQLRETELASVTRAAGAGGKRTEITFTCADNATRTIQAAEASKVSAAYARLTGQQPRALDPAYFSEPDHSDAAVAFLAHLGHCHTPTEAVGEATWRHYLDQAKGVEQSARHAVACDIATLANSDSTVAYLTRVVADAAIARWRTGRGGVDQVNVDVLADAASQVADAWLADTDSAWEAVPAAAPGKRTPLLDGTLAPRHTLGSEPFERYDFAPGIAGGGGIYAPEQHALEELSAALRRLIDNPDTRVITVAGAIAGRAHAVRTMPTRTLAERTERQWRLVELAELAERLDEDDSLVGAITLVTVNHPDQMVLFDSTDLRSAA